MVKMIEFLVFSSLMSVSAQASLMFDFKFYNVESDRPSKNPHFNTDGFVAGIISGLADNQPNQKSGFVITITDFPDALGGSPSNGLVATDWQSQSKENYISTSGGKITDINIAITNNSPNQGFDSFRLNFNKPGRLPNFNMLSFDEFDTMTANLGGLQGLNITTRQAPLPSTPEQVPAPITLALFGLGLAGLGYSRRNKGRPRS